MRVAVRGLAAVALVGYLVALAQVTLQPSADTASAGLEAVARVLERLGAPDEVMTPTRLEFFGNVAMLVPLPALGTLVWPRTNWRDWTAAAFLLSALIETSQAVWITERHATMQDIAANTCGGCLGGLLVAPLAWWLRSSLRRSRASYDPAV